MKLVLLSLAFVAMVASPVLAASDTEQCEMAAMQIDKVYGKRFDRQAAQVRTMAAQARMLQKQGKQSEALRVYEAAANAGAIQLTHPK